jgi:hypothetical protein
MKSENWTEANDAKMAPKDYYDELVRVFPDLKEKIEEWEEEMTHFKMEVFSEYTQDQIRKKNVSELKKCFDFQNSKIEGANDELLNCMNVSYCEALLLGGHGDEVEKFVSLMGEKLQKLYRDYETYYNELGNGSREN